MINLRVGCEFKYDVALPTTATVQVRPRSDSTHQLVTESWSTQPPVAVDEYADIYGNPVKRLVMAPGPLVLTYTAVVAVPDEPDADGAAAPQDSVEEVPGDLLHFTLPSRYCLSDELMTTAWELFG
ncbi:MAG: transglutaminase family protein, partial [Chloroflexi bacterium]